jgi:hypothetical protein
MTITTVALNNTFDEWRIRTNQVITSLNTINEANASLTGSITITNPLRFNGNVSLNVSSGMIKGDGGLLSNLQSSVVANSAFDRANAAFNAAVGDGPNATVTVVFSVANAAFNAANAAGSVTVSNTAPVTPGGGDLWWNTNYGRLFLYYNDGDTSQWVDTNPGASVVSVNSAYITANAGYLVANAAFNAANAAPNSSRVNTIFNVANAGYTTANAGFTVANAAFNAANNAGGGTTVVIGNESSSSNTFYLTLSSNTSGNVSSLNVSTSALTFVPSTGTLSATVFNSLSDTTLKDNVSPINNALDVINSLSGVGFDWKESGKHSFGVLAQDMEKVVPDLVGNINNLKTVNYDGIIAFLIEAIKELNNKLENKE